MHSRSTLFAAALVASLSSCASLSIDILPDPDAEFSNHPTYAWAPKPAPRVATQAPGCGDTDAALHTLSWPIEDGDAGNPRSREECARVAALGHCSFADGQNDAAHHDTVHHDRVVPAALRRSR